MAKVRINNNLCHTFKILFCCLYYYYSRRNTKSCPIDSLPLSVDGLFPDNYTKREISEQKVTCLNDGCDAIIPLLEADQHYASCEFNKNQVSHICLFILSFIIINNLQVLS